MATARAAKRYAEALMLAAEEQKLLERVGEDMHLLDSMVKEIQELALFLKSPIINKEKKQKIVQELFAKKVHSLTLSFLALITEKGREDILDEIIQQFFMMLDEKLGIVNVEVKAATAFESDQNASIQKKFEAIMRKKVRVVFSIDKQLKGGFIAQVGDTVYDGSVKRQLELLRERFAEGIGTN